MKNSSLDLACTATHGPQIPKYTNNLDSPFGGPSYPRLLRGFMLWLPVQYPVLFPLSPDTGPAIFLNFTWCLETSSKMSLRNWVATVRLD